MAEEKDKDPLRRKFTAAALRDINASSPPCGGTLLTEAVRCRDEAAVRFLLAHGAHPGKGEDDGRTPLHFAARTGHRGIMAALVAAGASVHATDKKGKGVLADALLSPDAAETLRYLLARGADPDKTDKTGRSALHDAAEAGHADAIRALLAAGANPDAQDGKGLRPLHLAAAKDALPAVQALVAGGADTCAASQQGETALHLAAQCREDAVFDFLMRQPCAALANAADAHGDMPLHHAARGGSLHKARQLVAQGAALSPRTAHGMTPLHLAVGNKDMAMSRLLLLHGADPGKAGEERWHTPMAHALLLGAPVEMLFLLLDYGASAHTRDLNGRTMLMMAAIHGDDATVNFLLDMGLDARAVTRDGRNVLHMCSERLNKDTLQRIIAAGPDINLRDADKISPLLHAVTEKHRTLAKLLIGAGADPDPADKSGMNPLIAAFSNRMLDVANKLISAEANPNAQGGPNNMTPLHYAAQMGLETETKRLLEKGARAESFDILGRTPLQHALQNAQVCIPVVLALLDAGADPLTPDNFGTSAYDMAHNRNHAQVIRLFDESFEDTPFRKPPLPKPPWLNWGWP